MDRLPTLEEALKQVDKWSVEYRNPGGGHGWVCPPAMRQVSEDWGRQVSERFLASTTLRALRSEPR